MTPGTVAEQHCGHERICYLFRKNMVALYDQTPCMRNHEGCIPCPHDTRSRPHPAPAQIPMRSCFGDFDDCPCDDECVVAEYCLKYQGKPKNSCGLTDSQCYEVQEHEKVEAARKARGEFIEQIEDKLPRYPSGLGDMYLLSDIQGLAPQQAGEP